MLARRRLPARRPALRRQRGEAEEPGEPGHGLHGPGRAGGGACRPWCWSGPARTGRRAAPSRARRSTPPATWRRARSARSWPPRPRWCCRRSRRASACPWPRPWPPGLPVVCSRGSALEEVAGGAATLVNPLDTQVDRGRHREACSTTRRWPRRSAQQGLEQQPAVRLGHHRRQTLEFYRRVLALTAAAHRAIGIDARELQGRPTGTGRYLRNLLRDWSRDRRRHASSPTSTGPRPDDPVLRPPARRGARRWAPRRGAACCWQERRLPAGRARATALDVFFCARLHLPAAPATCRA